MQIQMIKTTTGHTVYGPCAALMHIDNAGNVSYCNLWPDTPVHEALYDFYLAQK